MRPMVLDASVVVRFWLRDVPLADQASRLLASHADGEIEIHVPDLVYLEVTNAFWKLTRFASWPLRAARDATSQLLEMDLVSHPPNVAPCLDLALEHGMTVYDSAYVSLASHLGMPLLTADSRLVRRIGRAFPFLVSLG